MTHIKEKNKGIIFVSEKAGKRRSDGMKKRTFLFERKRFLHLRNKLIDFHLTLV